MGLEERERQETGALSKDVDGPFAVRRAVRDDVDAIVELDRLCFGHRSWSRRAWEPTVANAGWETVVVCEGARVVGALVVLPDVPEASIASVAVHPDRRGRGLGRRLVALAVQRSVRSGARRISLEVDADNDRAVNLYLGVGFAAVRRFREDGVERLEMVRPLHREVRLL